MAPFLLRKLSVSTKSKSSDCQLCHAIRELTIALLASVADDRRLADLVHSCTTRGSKRPLAVDLLVAGETMICNLKESQAGFVLAVRVIPFSVGSQYSSSLICCPRKACHKFRSCAKLGEQRLLPKTRLVAQVGYFLAQRVP